MDFLGVGPLEIIFILIIALIVMGPTDMAKTGRTLGRFLRKVVLSPTWQAVRQTSRDIRYLPNKLMREAGLEEQAEEMKKLAEDVQAFGKIDPGINQELRKASNAVNKGLSAWTTPPTVSSSPAPGSSPDAIPASPADKTNTDSDGSEDALGAETPIKDSPSDQK